VRPVFICFITLPPCLPAPGPSSIVLSAAAITIGSWVMQRIDAPSSTSSQIKEAAWKYPCNAALRWAHQAGIVWRAPLSSAIPDAKLQALQFPGRQGVHWLGRRQVAQPGLFRQRNGAEGPFFLCFPPRWSCRNKRTPLKGIFSNSGIERRQFLPRRYPACNASRGRFAGDLRIGPVIHAYLMVARAAAIRALAVLDKNEK